LAEGVREPATASSVLVFGSALDFSLVSGVRPLHVFRVSVGSVKRFHEPFDRHRTAILLMTLMIKLAADALGA